jgi:uncharacterized protein YjaG (DUF416 family)
MKKTEKYKLIDVLEELRYRIIENLHNNESGLYRAVRDLIKESDYCEKEAKVNINEQLDSLKLLEKCKNYLSFYGECSLNLENKTIIFKPNFKITKF